MGLRPTRANENQRRHPRAGGGPCPQGLDSRLRGNDMRAVIFRRVAGDEDRAGCACVSSGIRVTLGTGAFQTPPLSEACQSNAVPA
jgi:hypothetical protein